MNAFDMARSLVPKLNAGDRRKLSALLGRFPGAEEGVLATGPRLGGLDADWLFQGFQTELKRRGHPPFRGQIVALRSLAPNYELTSQETREFFEGKLRRPTRTELTALGGILGRSLAVHIEGRMPIALRSMLLNVGSTIEALERSFPDYLGTGMLPALLGRRIEQ